MTLHELAKRLRRTVEQDIIEFSTILAIHGTTRRNERAWELLNG
jgi:hypothetical protein